MMTAQYCKVLQLQEGSGRILKIFFGCVSSVLGQGGSNGGHHGVATA